MSGTTRDAIDTDITGPDGRTFKLIDTAGIRRRTAVAGARLLDIFQLAGGTQLEHHAAKRADVEGVIFTVRAMCKPCPAMRV